MDENSAIRNTRGKLFERGGICEGMGKSFDESFHSNWKKVSAKKFLRICGNHRKLFVKRILARTFFV